jgi:alanine or glycine:cation symporter, AGCS family
MFENALAALNDAVGVAVDLAWGTPLVVLLLGGGAWLLVSSQFLPFFQLRHAIDVLRGRYDDPNAPGEITHLQALSTALSSTIGLGNIGGVAIAISQGGPGAVFWMWVAAIVGMATKYFTCTLSILYRGTDDQGVTQGGPMYYIEHGLGRRWRFLSVLFSVCGMIGCLAMFQTNQLAEILVGGYTTTEVEALWLSRGVGAAAVLVVAVVIFGGVERIAKVASRLVPTMCIVYLVLVLAIIAQHATEVPAVFALIVEAAFNPAAAGGAVAGVTFMTVLRTGVKRAAFSNEAGIGTAAMAHGAARTNEPVREGLVAMMGPFIDTVIVCSLTAFAILLTGSWSMEGVTGVSMTMSAFESELGLFGKLALTAVVLMFSFSTMFGYSYYGRKCFVYLFGTRYAFAYNVFFVGMLYVGAVYSAELIVNTLDTAFALMAFPNMLATLILAPKVMAETRRYFAALAESNAVR